MWYQSLILNAGPILAYVVIFLFIFAEAGLFIGFLLPGDTLIFTLGILAAQGHLQLGPLLLIGMLGAILGDSTGYYWGWRTGASLFHDNKSRFFKKKYVEQAQDFYERHGRFTVFIARFTPVVRTFAPMLAGMSSMRYREFLPYNALAGVCWMLSLTLAGYFLGQIPFVQKYFLHIMIGIAVVSLTPVLIQAWREQKRK